MNSRKSNHSLLNDYDLEAADVGDFVLLNRHNFSPVDFNCVVQSNSVNGLLEIIAIRDIQVNERIVFWFADNYFKNIKCKLLNVISDADDAALFCSIWDTKIGENFIFYFLMR
jgi:hypothetical protein